jgi:hypothetical protein
MDSQVGTLVLSERRALSPCGQPITYTLFMEVKTEEVAEHEFQKVSFFFFSFFFIFFFFFFFYAFPSPNDMELTAIYAVTKRTSVITTQ